MRRIKTLRALAVELCRREGLKKQVDIAQMLEILGHLSDIFYEYESIDYLYAMKNAEIVFKQHHPPNDPCDILIANGARRAKKKAKNAKK